MIILIRQDSDPSYICGKEMKSKKLMYFHVQKNKQVVLLNYLPKENTLFHLYKSSY